MKKVYTTPAIRIQLIDTEDIMEIFLVVNSKDTHFAGNYAWETADKKWISWAGKKITDFDSHTTGINEAKNAVTNAKGYYRLNGQRVASPSKGLYINNGKKYIAK